MSAITCGKTFIASLHPNVLANWNMKRVELLNMFSNWKFFRMHVLVSNEMKWNEWLDGKSIVWQRRVEIKSCLWHKDIKITGKNWVNILRDLHRYDTKHLSEIEFENNFFENIYAKTAKQQRDDMVSYCGCLYSSFSDSTFESLESDSTFESLESWIDEFLSLVLMMMRKL